MAQRRRAREGATHEAPALRVSRAEAGHRIEDRIQLGQVMRDRQIASDQELADFRSDFHAWHDYNGTLLLKLFTTAEIHDDYQPRVFSPLSSSPNPRERVEGVRKDIQRQVERLTSILGRLELFDETDPDAAAAADAGSRPGPATVFVVHGHDDERKLEVASFIERVTGRRPTILHEQASRGRTIIEKFEGHAGEAGFAVVLLTGDDVGGVSDASLQRRARQNVVLELGFFMGSLGRSRVVALCEEDVERPSDIDGLLYVPLAGEWKLQLAREMRAASIDVDLGKA